MDIKESRQLRQDISPVGAWAFAIGTSIGWGSLVVTTAIGWIVDGTTIGATIIYALVSASARKLARTRNDRTELWTGGIGLVLMVFYLLYLLLPNLVSEGSMARESYFLFIVWTVLGFLYFRSILQRDHTQRFGKSLIVWMVLLGLVLFVALIWMRQSMMEANHHMMENIRLHYLASTDGSAVRLEDEQFIASQIGELEKADTRTMVMATGMFVFALMIMLSNYPRHCNDSGQQRRGGMSCAGRDRFYSKAVSAAGGRYGLGPPHRRIVRGPRYPALDGAGSFDRSL